MSFGTMGSRTIRHMVLVIEYRRSLRPSTETIGDLTHLRECISLIWRPDGVGTLHQYREAFIISFGITSSMHVSMFGES